MKLVSVTFDKDSVRPGDTLVITAKLHNDGAAGVTGTAPASGYTYREGDTFQAGYPPVDGTFRLVAGTLPQMTPVNYPYRWSWQGTLAPGGDVTVVGKVLIEVPCGALWYVALVQEKNNFIGPQRAFTKAIPFGAPGGGAIDQVARDAIQHVETVMRSV